MLLFAVAAVIWASSLCLVTALSLWVNRYRFAWFSSCAAKVDAISTRIGKFADQCDQHQALVMFGIGVFAILLRVAFLPILPIPIPIAHDEFSYLLGADTFASGRLTNPTHPLWHFFETLHVLFQPTYASKYPPAQAMFMAAGQLLGHCWYGVLASYGLMCASIYWMARGYLPGRWALLTALLPLVHPGICHYWCNSYWGGCVAATGGALVFGACVRLSRQITLVPGVVLAIGLAILANSRPYEGLVCAGVAFCGMLLQIVRRRKILHRPHFATVFVPILILTITTAWMLYYNYRVVGNPFRMPSAEYIRQYMRTPLWHGEKLYPEPVYHNQQLKDFWTILDVIHYNKLQTASGWLDSIGNLLLPGYFSSFIGLAFLPLFGAALLSFSDKRVRWLWAATLAMFVCQVLLHYFQRHYLAPVTGPTYVLLVQGFRHLRQIKVREQPIGILLSRLLLMTSATAFFIGLLFAPQQWKQYEKEQDNIPRAKIDSKIASLPGKHLVIVHFAKGHEPGHEYVYNKANIDDSKVVWARDLGAEKNKQLLNYYPERKVWVLDVDANPKPLLYTLEESKRAKLTDEVNSDSWAKP